MSSYVRLDEAPYFVIHRPTCSACWVELDIDDCWVCPSCGTQWPDTAREDEPGELYESWSGEALEGPTLTSDQAREWASYRQALARHQRNPDVFPVAPRRPSFMEEED